MLEQSQPEFRALAVTVERRRPSAIGGMLAKVLWSATEGAVTARPSGMNIFAIRHIVLNYTALCTKGGCEDGPVTRPQTGCRFSP